MISLKPVCNKVWVEKIQPVKSGIFFLAEDLLPEPDTGIVLGFGPEVTGLEIGDVVSFPKYNGVNFSIKGKKYFMIEDAFILLVH